MSSANQNLDLSYGLSQPIVAMNPRNIIGNRNPGNADLKPIGTLWINKSTNGVYVLSSITGNIPNWASTSGAAGLFTSVTSSTFVQAGTNIIAQTGNISATVGAVSAGTTVTAGTGITATTGNISATAGAVSANTTVTAGTGITATTGNISAAAGAVSANTTVTAGTSITATLGNITATNGNVVLSTAATFVQLPGPIKIMSGAGAPGAGLAAEAGDLYIRTDPAGAASRIYVATGAGVFTNVTCAA